jgi:ATP-binding cassette subfamily F protein 3
VAEREAILEVDDVRRAFGGVRAVDGVSFALARGEIRALIGPNGAGKSTLMRLLAAVDRPDAGVRIAGHQVVPDYFAQDQAAVLTSGRTVYEEMSSASPVQMVPMIRHILGGFLFSGDDIYKRVGVLSGGERNRLALAKMLLNPSNLLLLDEPTNHLDLDSKEVLLDALSDYGGTLIFVSHDRYFVDRLSSKVIEVGGGQALVYPGGYEDFLYWKKQQAAGLAPPLPTRERKPVTHLKEAPPAAKSAPASAPVPAKAPPKAVSAKREDRDPAPAKDAPGRPSYDPLAPRLRPAAAPPDRQARERELRKAKARLAELEKQIGEKEQAVKDIEHLMATPGFYDDRATADRSVAQRQQLLTEVEALMSEWESLQTAAEAKGGG